MSEFAFGVVVSVVEAVGFRAKYLLPAAVPEPACSLLLLQLFRAITDFCVHTGILNVVVTL